MPAPARPAAPAASDGGDAPDDVTAPVDDLLDRAVAALGGAAREGQRAMARAVAETLERGEHLLVQAGTGTGKSLGYLVPAVRHAVLEDERVVVSTATLALQRQVLTRDLPLVADALAPALPRPPRIALLKGWHNYLCAHKVAGGYPQEEPGALFDLGDRGGAAEHPEPAGSGGGTGGTGGPGGGGRGRGGGGGGESLGEQVVRLRPGPRRRGPATATTSCPASRTGPGARSRSPRWSASARRAPWSTTASPSGRARSRARPTSS
ncbi:DEAD/DEAH box helicase [Cellulomonas endophytica]|uniref:DEAD/DEAH box helicase n=1 Tax=Cellulomonas endophytica TaxID=2494735 RepID=UPI001011E92C|nr:DEAD/DEAH box helicase [Cellulomonas endophytica]